MMSRFFRVLKTSDMHKSVLRTWFHTYKHTYYCAWIKWLLLRTSFLYYPNEWLHRRKKKRRSNGGAVLNDTTELYYIIWLSTCVVCTHLMMSRFFRILQTCDMHKSVLRTWFHTYKHTYYCAWIKWLLLRTSFYTILTNVHTQKRILAPRQNNK
jgi:hypothetical protein